MITCKEASVFLLHDTLGCQGRQPLQARCMAAPAVLKNFEGNQKLQAVTMIPLKIFSLLLLVCSATTTPLKAAPRPRSRTPVYFPIDAAEFENFGVRFSSGASKSLSRGRGELPPSTTPKPITTTMRLPIAQESHVAPPANFGVRFSSGASKSLSRGRGELPPSTTPKPITTTMRLPIAQESHVAPPAVVTSSPLAYLTDSSYYIPGRTTESPGSFLGHQLLSGSPIFDDDDLANRYIAVHGSSELKRAELDRADNTESRNTEKELAAEEEQQEVLSRSSNLEDQERYGLFFVGEEESFGGSEEHFEQVSYPNNLHVPPQEDYRESEDRGAVLQSLPEVRPSSLYFDSVVSVNEPAPVYRPPSRVSSRYDPPEDASPVPSYDPPSTERSYRPPSVETAISTTERAYRAPTTTERSYRPSTTETSYRSSTTERSYKAPTTTEISYRRSTSAERSNRIPTTTERSYRQPTTTERSYIPPSLSIRTRRPSKSSRVYSPPVTERTYESSTTEITYKTTAERQSRPPIRQRKYQPPTTERSYKSRSTTEKPYQPTTEKAYRLPQQSVEKSGQESVPSRSYTPIRNRYTPPTTTQRPYTQARRTTVRTYNPPSTTTRKPYSHKTIKTPSTTERSYGAMKLVSVRKYTGPPVEASTAKSYSKSRVSSKQRGTGRPRTRYVAPLRAAKTTQSNDPKKSTHSLYFRPKTSVQNEETAFGSKLSDSSEEDASNYSRARQPTYSAPKNMTIKSITVASSTSISKQRRKPAMSRSSSTYKFPFKNPAPATKKSLPVSVKHLASRAGSKYEPPVYRTSTKAFRAPSALYGHGESTADVVASLQQNFIQAADNIYVPEEYDESAIPGEAGRDYPILSQVPDTDFQCEAQQHPGLYADTSAQCQVFHICQESGRHDSFLCPNGTVFNQQYFVCDWWYNFSCDSAASFFGLNEFIYELPEDNYKSA
ncbi:Chitin binding domain [Trinorchestia longiramus]|nr:Chitin binding domain [Trinorchestia longiramus]